MRGSRGPVRSMGYMCLAGSPRENTRTNLFCVWSKKVECGGGFIGSTFWKGFPNMCYTVRESLCGCRRQSREAAMAQTSPIIQDGIITDLREGYPVQIVVDSSAGYTWLQ